MAVSRPGARVTVGGRSFAGPEAGLVRIRVSLSVRGPHDGTELVCAAGSPLADAKPGTALEIALGESGSEQTVLTGEISSRTQAPGGLALEGLSATVVLSRTRATRVFAGQTVAEIVRTLASGADLDEVSGDLRLDAYAVDGRRSVWGHLQELAGLAGADLGSTPAGALRFVPVADPATPARTLCYGADLLAWNLERSTAAAPPAIHAHGAASEAGASRWHWLARDPVGPGAEGPARIVAALATRDAAEKVGAALGQRARLSAERGWLRIPGSAALRPGQVVETAGLPAGDSGPLRVIEVEHDLDPRQGFVTTLRVQGSGTPGGALGEAGP